MIRKISRQCFLVLALCMFFGLLSSNTALAGESVNESLIEKLVLASCEWNEDGTVGAARIASATTNCEHRSPYTSQTMYLGKLVKEGEGESQTIKFEPLNVSASALSFKNQSGNAAKVTDYIEGNPASSVSGCFNFVFKDAGTYTVTYNGESVSFGVDAIRIKYYTNIDINGQPVESSEISRERLLDSDRNIDYAYRTNEQDYLYVTFKSDAYETVKNVKIKDLDNEFNVNQAAGYTYKISLKPEKYRATISFHVTYYNSDIEYDSQLIMQKCYDPVTGFTGALELKDKYNAWEYINYNNTYDDYSTLDLYLGTADGAGGFTPLTVDASEITVENTNKHGSITNFVGPDGNKVSGKYVIHFFEGGEYKVKYKGSEILFNIRKTKEPSSENPGSGSSGGGATGGTDEAGNKNQNTETIKNPDGSTTEKTKETNADGSTVVTEKTTGKDGSVTEKETTKATDGSVTEKETTKSADGTVTESEKVTAKDGRVTEKSTTTEADGTVTESKRVESANGKVTEKSVETKPDGTVTETAKTEAVNGKVTERVTVTEPDGAVVETKTTTKVDGSKVTNVTNTSADGKEETSVAVSYKADGTAAKATVEVAKEVEGKKLTVSTADLKEMVSDAGAGKKNTEITLTAKDDSGKEKFSVSIDPKNLTNKSLVVYTLDKKGNLVMVDTSKNTAKVGKDGDLDLNISGKGDFTIINSTEAAKIDKAILKTVEPAKKEASVEEGKKTTFKLSSDCNKKNIANITYKTNNKNVKVDKNGKITANSSGTTTVTATITLKNGKTKTVKMKINVK